jgi:hypothetical protein
MSLPKLTNLNPEQELEEDWPITLQIKRISPLKKSKKMKVHLISHLRNLKPNQRKRKVKIPPLLNLRMG